MFITVWKKMVGGIVFADLRKSIFSEFIGPFSLVAPDLAIDILPFLIRIRMLIKLLNRLGPGSDRFVFLLAFRLPSIQRSLLPCRNFDDNRFHRSIIYDSPDNSDYISESR